MSTKSSELEKYIDFYDSINIENTFPFNVTKEKDGKFLLWSIGESNKKYKVMIFDKRGKKIKTVQFGDKRYTQYKDKTPLKLYSHLDHKDKKRRERYRTRHEAIKTKEGKKAYKIKYSPSWFSYNYLW